MAILFVSACLAPILRPGRSPCGRVSGRTAVPALALKSPREEAGGLGFVHYPRLKDVKLLSSCKVKPYLLLRELLGVMGEEGIISEQIPGEEEEIFL